MVLKKCVFAMFDQKNIAIKHPRDAIVSMFEYAFALKHARACERYEILINKKRY